MNSELDDLIIVKKEGNKEHLKNNWNSVILINKELQGELKSLIESYRQNYYERLSLFSVVLTGNATGTKILNGKRIPTTPPLLQNNVKSKFFDVYISKQCSEMQNGSITPSVIWSLTHRWLSFFQLLTTNIKIIRDKLDPNKRNGHAMINVCMIKWRL